MTTLIREATRLMPTVDVAGVSWPLNKLLAVLCGVLAGVSVMVFGGTMVVAAWMAAAAAVTAWWGGYAWYGRRWDDGRREYAADSSREI